MEDESDSASSELVGELESRGRGLEEGPEMLEATESALSLLETEPEARGDDPESSASELGGDPKSRGGEPESEGAELKGDPESRVRGNCSTVVS